MIVPTFVFSIGYSVVIKAAFFENLNATGFVKLSD